MKAKIKMLLVWALAVSTYHASAQVLSINSIEAQAGSQAVLTVNLDELNTSTTALQFNLTLPAGITLNESAITKGEAAMNHELVIRPLGSGEHLFILYNMDKNLLTNGHLLSIPVNLSANPQTLTGAINTFRMSTPDAISYSGMGTEFQIMLTDDIENLKDADSERLNSVVIYDLQGRRIARTQKGVNILHYSDGTTKRMLVK